MICNSTLSKPLSALAAAVTLFFSPLVTHAEGAKELMADPSSRAALSTVSGSFAAWNSTSKPYARLNIHIASPATEVVHLGFSMGYSTDASETLGVGSPYTTAYLFRILDPAGNVVYGPQELNATNSIPAGAAGYNQIMAGPAATGNASGYTGFTYQPASGAAAGDYYIEFTKKDNVGSLDQISFDYWDITVAGAGQVINGRVWSQRWGFYSRDYPNLGEFSGRFKGQLFSYTTEGLVEKITFNGGGIRGGSFLIAMNASGPGTSGNLAEDRKSLYKQGKSSTGYKLFLNDPDAAAYPTGDATLPTFTFTSLNIPCASAGININYSLNRAGTVQVVLDFNKNGSYDAGTRDVVLLQNAAAGSNTLFWDRKDGLDMTVSDADLAAINVLGLYTLGTHHLSFDDIELLEDGFTVTQVRPVFTAGPEDKFYWDDSRIAASSPGFQAPYLTGPQPPAVNLTGLPVRKWNNFTDNNTIGFGNKNSINTWWAAYDATATGRFLPLGCSLLPVTITQFGGRAIGCAVQLSWQTAGEKGVDRYEIEHSAKGSAYAKVGQVKSSNGTADKGYSYTFNGQNGEGSFRLRIVDEDGSVAYSHAVRISSGCGAQPVISVSPNPAASIVALQGVAAGQLIVVSDATGRPVMQQRAGANDVTLNISSLPNGLYLLYLLEGNARIYQTKLIKK